MSNTAMKLNYNSNIVSFEELRNKRNGREDDSNTVKEYVEHPSCEVYAFKSEEEIKAMFDVFDKKIEESHDDYKRMFARRNKLVFITGINCSLRASDLRLITWGFFFDENGNFKDSYKIMPKKTKKYKKYVTVYFNDAIKAAVKEYVKMYPYKSLDDYVFASQRNDDPILVSSIWRIIKSAAREANLPQNIGSHSLRKTFGFWAFHNARDKQKALVILQQIFNHSDTTTTMKYIGLMDDEISEVFNNLNLGIDYI